MRNSALLTVALASALGSCTGMEGLTPRGVPTDKAAIYLFNNDIVREVCISKFIMEYCNYYRILLTKVSAQQVLNRLQRSGILSKSFNIEIKDFEYKLNTQESI